MSIDDYVFFDDIVPDSAEYLPIERACRYCGHEGLHWEQVDGRWRLFDDADVMHTCSEPTGRWRNVDLFRRQEDDD